MKSAAPQLFLFGGLDMPLDLHSGLLDQRIIYCASSTIAFAASLILLAASSAVRFP